MPTSLSGRNFLKLLDFTPDEIRYLIKLSKDCLLYTSRCV